MKHVIQDADGNQTIVDLVDLPQQPLDSVGALATLLVVTGQLGLMDAANAIGQTPETLVAEAEAWAVAQSVDLSV